LWRFVIGGGAITRSLRISRVVFIALLMSISQPLVFAEAINGPAAQANIHATHIASNFASEINPGQYYTNPNTKRDYYLIGSIERNELTTPNANTTVVVNKTAIIQPASNETTPTTDSKIETIQPTPDINISMTKNTYNILIIESDNKTETIHPITDKTTKNEGYYKHTVDNKEDLMNGWPEPTGTTSSQETSISAVNIDSDREAATTRQETIGKI
jgi:hypothetical protein